MLRDDNHIQHSVAFIPMP